MIAAIRSNIGLKVLSLVLAIVGWSYFRFASNPLVSARFDQQLNVPIAATNLAPGEIARFPETTAVVTVDPKRGDPPIKPDEIKAVLDLSNRAPGVYNVPVDLVAPSVAIQSLSPASVTLTIERIDAKSFPVAMHYSGQANVVVTNFTVSPASVSVRGADDDLSQVATVRVDMPLGSARSSFDAMIRPEAVNAAGDPIRDVQVTPNLVRVQAQLIPAKGS